MNLPLLTAENLTGGYQARSVIHHLNLDLQQGEWLSLLGGNGSGKSTLLKLLSRLLAPQKGVVLLDGKAIHHQPPHLVAQQLALLPQQQTVPSGLTVRQLVSLGRTPHQPWWQWQLTSTDLEQVDRSMSLTQVDNFADRPVESLSGGERQRVFLALALAQNPQILLLDEPTTYLDLRYQLDLLTLLANLQRQQELTIITVLHELNLAIRYSDRLAMLKNGHLVALGSPQAVVTPAVIADVFEVNVAIIDTPVGLQICPLTTVN
ncbi:MAG: ABC transporter ATP-binding protein [Candidatus Saccharibacteria bacterium]|nr:ABC transporter ATP-binding protein [Candidatus Saccharibacteria bacterium]